MMKRLLSILIIAACGGFIFFYRAPDTVANGISYYGRLGFPFVYAQEWGEFGGQILLTNFILDVLLWIFAAVLIVLFVWRGRRTLK